VSALMSGVMLKTAIYGLVRVTFDLLHVQLWWWGAIALAVGLVTALFGVIFAAAQTDMKRLLAYSSIENIGVIVSGIALAILFRAYDKSLLAAIALTAALYHCLNHAFFKSLLFLATGSVLHATKERSLGRLGGLIHRMPWVAWLTLVGTLAIAGLPPLNGFVSEWLLLQAFLFTPTLPQTTINMLVPVAAAALVLAVALSAYVMVKFYGVIFLGRPREPHLAYAHDAGRRERAALAYLAAGCVLLGLFPTWTIAAIDHVNGMLLATTVSRAGESSWLLLAPIATDRSSYSPLIVLVVIVATVLVTIQVVHRLWHGRVRRAAAWDCGFPLQTARMQDTAEGFGQPIRQVFEPFFRMERHLPTPFDAKPRYFVSATDHFWHWLYLPIVRATDAVARLAGLLQRGRIAVYLTYSFVTLLALLFLVR
jgi:formate hydrogenlyase subunit 3/multisubunit Na+/H+ antiporter MnhD subunit